MKRRLTIARSLINEPEILLLDEPTTGLDPQARHVVWDRLFRLKQQGVTLVLTTHYMDEAEQLCDRLVVMDGGRIAAEGSPRELIERYSTPRCSSCASIRLSTSRRRRSSPTLPPTGWRSSPTGYCSMSRTGTRAGRRPRARAGAADLAGPAEHAGGRLPAAHRPAAGGLMAASRLRAVRPPGPGRGAPAGTLAVRCGAAVLADQLPPDLARLDLLQRAESGAVPGRHGPGPGHAGRPARPGQAGRGQLPGLPGSRACWPRRPCRPRWGSPPTRCSPRSSG